MSQYILLYKKEFEGSELDGITNAVITFFSTSLSCKHSQKTLCNVTQLTLISKISEKIPISPCCQMDLLMDLND